MEEQKEIKVSLAEKIVINWALPSDFLYHTIKAFLLKDKSQTLKERMLGLWNGKTAKYVRLLEMKKEHGSIPRSIRLVCNKTLCGQTRLILALARKV